jgi:hypothetical protein
MAPGSSAQCSYPELISMLIEDWIGKPDYSVYGIGIHCDHDMCDWTLGSSWEDRR